MRQLHLLARATLLLATTPFSLAGQSDSARPPLFTRRDAAFISVFSVATLATTRFDARIAQWMARPDLAERPRLINAASTISHVNEKTLFLAGLAGYGISRIAAGPGSAGADISLHVSEAVLISTVFNTIVRGTLGRSRPFITGGTDPYDFHFAKGWSNFDYRAFPSLHSSASFATAAVLTGEAQRRSPRAAPWVGVVSYGLATLPALARVYSGKHWASDVLMGAFVGTLTGMKVLRHEHDRGESWLTRKLLR